MGDVGEGGGRYGASMCVAAVIVLHFTVKCKMEKSGEELGGFGVGRVTRTGRGPGGLWGWGLHG
jgi:hypothetical protein